MRSNTIKVWSWVHTWSSLVCSLFLLMLCLTGLPLIFHDEIDEILNNEEWVPTNPKGELVDLDTILINSLHNRPSEVPVFMSFDIDRPVINVTTAPSADSKEKNMHFASYDQTNGELLSPENRGEAFMHFLLQLHTDLFLGLPGMLFLGLMGILFIVATLSGIVLYKPYMRRMKFGSIRTGRSMRVKWLDYHNLLGITTVAWVLVVGLTGVVNTLAVPIVDLWQSEELADLVNTHQSDVVATSLSSIDDAVASATQVAPNMTLQFVAFPGSSYSTNRHFAIFLHGNTPLTSHLITPVLVDAVTGEFVGLREMPWYTKILSLSQPLHFGNYGGIPLKIIWAVLTLITIVILISGLVLWVIRNGLKSNKAVILDNPSPISSS